MSIFDSILAQAGHADLADLADKLGLPADMAEKAVAALGQSHGEPGDTIAAAAAKTGLDTGVLGQIVHQLGGEGMLGQYAQAMQNSPQLSGVFKWLDQDGDGNPIHDVMSAVGKLLGKT
mgnify:CR=1 FL=1